MDHEFFTHSIGEEQVGWDWLSVQLEDDTELMLYQLRRKDGSADPFSSGTYGRCAREIRSFDGGGFPAGFRGGDLDERPYRS